MRIVTAEEQSLVSSVYNCKRLIAILEIVEYLFNEQKLALSLSVFNLSKDDATFYVHSF